MEKPPEPGVNEKIPRQYRFLTSLLRVFFSLLYHQFAWTYDWVAAIVSAGLWQTWVISVLPFLTGSHILELGHGPGHLQVALGQQKLQSAHQETNHSKTSVILPSSDPQRSQIIGLDRSPQMGRITKRRLRKAGIQSCLVNAQAERLPFPANSFDQVVATFPTEYIADSHTLAEIYRVLTTTGQVVILLGAWITGRSPTQLFAAWLFRVTGQAPDWNDAWLAPLQQVGFQARVEKTLLESSTLLFILAQKA
jgi:ubiquinone/menaquinone biosynthesis C-methylase UbiE